MRESSGLAETRKISSYGTSERCHTRIGFIGVEKPMKAGLHPIDEALRA
jgi:hypothetical protein